jgi:hypothetical protein
MYTPLIQKVSPDDGYAYGFADTITFSAMFSRFDYFKLISEIQATNI